MPLKPLDLFPLAQHYGWLGVAQSDSLFDNLANCLIGELRSQKNPTHPVKNSPNIHPSIVMFFPNSSISMISCDFFLYLFLFVLAHVPKVEKGWREEVIYPIDILLLNIHLIIINTSNWDREPHNPHHQWWKTYPLKLTATR